MKILPKKVKKMNSRKTYPIVILALFGGLLTTADAKTMSVQVRETALRSSPSYLGRPVATLEYGDAVHVVQAKGPWQQVRDGGKQGWVHESALTQKKIVLKASHADIDTAASEDEIAMAGKGFNEEVERAFKSERGSRGFKQVDAMERRQVSDHEVADFLRAGGLTEGDF